MGRALILVLVLAGCHGSADPRADSGGSRSEYCGVDSTTAATSPPAATSACWTLMPPTDGTIVVAPDATTGPEGVGAASLVQAASAGGQSGYAVARAVYLDAPGTYSFEFWAKGAGGAAASYAVWAEEQVVLLGHPIASFGDYMAGPVSYVAQLGTGEWSHIAQDVTVTRVPVTLTFMPLEHYTSSSLYIAGVRVVRRDGP
jgi:hypothetical protein